MNSPIGLYQQIETGVKKISDSPGIEELHGMPLDEQNGPAVICVSHYRHRQHSATRAIRLKTVALTGRQCAVTDCLFVPFLADFFSSLILIDSLSSSGAGRY